MQYASSYLCFLIGHLYIVEYMKAEGERIKLLQQLGNESGIIQVKIKKIIMAFL